MFSRLWEAFPAPCAPCGGEGWFTGIGRRFGKANGTLGNTLNLPVGGGGGNPNVHLDLGVVPGKTAGGGCGGAAVAVTTFG